MLIHAPVYNDENGLHHISIYAEHEDGTFVRTMDEPLRLLRDNIKGVSIPQGELVSHQFDRVQRKWESPTITYHYGRPQSFYRFLRKNVARNKFFVFSKPSLSGRLSKFQLHELQLKPTISQRKVSLLKEKYMEAINLWSKEEYTENTKQLKLTAEAQEELDYQATQKIDPADLGNNSIIWLEEDNSSHRKSLVVITAKQAKCSKAERRKNRGRNRHQKAPIAAAKDQDTQLIVKPGNHEKDSHFYRRFVFMID